MSSFALLHSRIEPLVRIMKHLVRARTERGCGDGLEQCIQLRDLLQKRDAIGFN